MEQTIIADALDNLRVHQRQLDADGCEVGVSRQALNEAITYIGRLTADRDFWKERFQVETRARIETEAQLAEARKALEPFAKVAEHDIGDDETDDDIFWPISNARYSMSGRLRVGHLRAARLRTGAGRASALSTRGFEVLSAGYSTPLLLRHGSSRGRSMRCMPR